MNSESRELTDAELEAVSAGKQAPIVRFGLKTPVPAIPVKATGGCANGQCGR